MYATECRLDIAARIYISTTTRLDIERRFGKSIAREGLNLSAVRSASSLNDTKGLHVERPDASRRILELSHA